MAIANGTCVSFCNPWVRPWDNRGKWMKRGFNACQTYRSMYLSIFNRFPVIQPVSSKVRDFSTFNDCQTHRSMYPQPSQLMRCSRRKKSVKEKTWQKEILPVILRLIICPGWTRRMAIVTRQQNVSFCNPWVRPWDNRGKWMKRGFNAGQTHRSMYPSVFDRLRAIARYWSAITTFSYFPCI